MALNLNDIGIQSSLPSNLTTSSFVESVDYERKAEEVVVTNHTGAFGAAELFDPTVDVTIAGKGDLHSSIVAGGTDVAALQINGVTTNTTSSENSGSFVVTSIRTSESASDFNTFEISGTYYPAARSTNP